ARPAGGSGARAGAPLGVLRLRGPFADRLDLEKLLDAPAPALAADARLLVAAERHSGDALGAVDLYHARPELARHAPRALGVAGLQVGCEAVRRVVGHGDGVGLGVERRDGELRSEYLLPVDGQLVGHVGEHCGSGEVPALDAGGAARTAG